MMDTNFGTIRSALVGSGHISEQHLISLRSIPDCTVVGVCDLSRAAAEYTAAHCGARSYTDLDAMLAQTKPHVVHVLTPPASHEAIVRSALTSGAHVLCEKPLALSGAATHRLLNEADRMGLRLFETHNYRFNDDVLAIERAVEAGQIGDVREVEVRMHLGIREPGSRYADPNLPHPSHRLPAGVLHEFISHLGYLVLRFAPDPTDLRAIWSNHEGGFFRFDDLDAIASAGPVHLRIRFSASIRPECFELVIRGTKGYLRTDLFQPVLIRSVPRMGGSKVSPIINQFVQGITLARGSVGNFAAKVLDHTPYHGLHRLIAQIYHTLRHGDEPPVTRRDIERLASLVDRLIAEQERSS